jgi:hypothetical protein
MAYMSMTGFLRSAYERECRGLSCTERGALWSLTSLADCRWAGADGIVRAEHEALKQELGYDGCLTDLLKGLQRKGRVRILRDEDARVELQVCFWYDLWWQERMKNLKRTMKRKG